MFACEPGDVSLLHVLFYAHSAGSFQMAIDTGGGAQQDRFVGGSQVLCDKMAEALGPDVVTTRRAGTPHRRRRRPGHGGVRQRDVDVPGA